MRCAAGDALGQVGVLLLGDVVGILVGLPLLLPLQLLLQALDFDVAAAELGDLVTLRFEGSHVDLALDALGDPVGVLLVSLAEGVLVAVEVHVGPLNGLVLYQRGVEAGALLKFLDHHNRLPP